MANQGSDGKPIGLSETPSWDGAARGWRRYVKEVQWYVLGTKPNVRRYLASRLISKLTGSARLLAMTWQLQDFNNVDGVKVMLTKLSQSPLVRKSLPNAASIMGQYFACRRGRQEPILNFLIREALHYEEFRECLIHLKEEQLGLGPERNGFGLPQVDETTEHEDTEGDDSTAGATSPTREAQRARGPDRSSGYQRLPQQDPAEGASEAVLSLSDSFILEQLRGWRLLTSASLNPEEWRDVLGTTQGKLDYQSVSDALQVLYDDQMTGASRHQGVMYPGHQLNVSEHYEDYDD